MQRRDLWADDDLIIKIVWIKLILKYFPMLRLHKWAHQLRHDRNIAGITFGDLLCKLV